MSTDSKRTHGAQPEESEQKPKILMAIRTTAKVDEKGRAIEGTDSRKVYVEGMEDELLDELSDDQLAYLESGGFVSGLGIALPNEQTLKADPTIRAGATRKKGSREIEIPKTATISGPRNQAQASAATTLGRAEAGEGSESEAGGADEGSETRRSKKSRKSRSK